MKAANNDGYWSPEARSIDLVIRSPFWATVQFKASLALGFIVILIVSTRWRIGRINQQKLILEQTVTERTRDLQTANARLSEANSELESEYTRITGSQQRIEAQNKELLYHRNNLESMVRQRTMELESAKENAVQSDRLKSAFLANISHEIRTPMNAIIGLLQVINDDQVTSPEERQRYMEIVMQSSNTLLNLINDILDLSRIEAGEASLRPPT